MVLSLIAKIKNCAKNTFHLDQLWHGLLKRGETPELKSAVLHTSAQCHGVVILRQGRANEERITVLQHIQVSDFYAMQTFGDQKSYN